MAPPFLERINAGELDRLINIVLKEQATADDGGSVDTPVVLACNVPARYKPLRGSERQYGPDGESFAQVEFAIRFIGMDQGFWPGTNVPYSGIGPKYYIEYNNTEFDVFEALPNDNRTFLVIQAKARDLQSGGASI